MRLALRGLALVCVSVCVGGGASPVAAADAVAAAQTLPIGDFVRDPSHVNPRLSPDGKHLAVTTTAVVDGRDVPLVTVIALDDMKVVSSIRLPVFQVPLDVRWVSDTRLIVAKGQEIGSLDQPRNTGEILATNLDGSKQDYLYGRDRFASAANGMQQVDDHGWGHIAGLPSPRNGRFFLREERWNEQSRHSTLYDIDATRGTRKLVADLPVDNLDFLLQHDGQPRFAFGGGTDNRLVVFRREPGQSDWQRLPADKVAARFRPLAFTADDKDAYVLFSADGRRDSLVREDMASGEHIVLASDPIGSIDRLLRGPGDGEPFAAATNVGIPKPLYFAAGRPEAALHKALSTQFPGSYVEFANFSQDGNRLVFLVHSDRDPGSYYLLDRNAMKAELLFQVEPWIDPARMAERRPINFKARDGLSLHGYLTLPPGRAAKQLPMVLLPHGGPHGIADEWFYDRDAQFLASRGYAVLQVNYRGSGGRGIRFMAAGYRHWGTTIQNDLIDGVHWAIDEGVADAQRVCVYGGSFGGYSAMMAPVREPGLFKCAVGYAGLYSLPSLYKRDNTAGHTLATNIYIDYIGQDPAELASNSPTRWASQITLPVLMVHGTEDTTTPVDQAREMRDALAKAGHPPEWLEVPGEGHGFYLTKNRALFYQRLEAFLAKHIGPGAARGTAEPAVAPASGASEPR